MPIFQTVYHYDFTDVFVMGKKLMDEGFVFDIEFIDHDVFIMKFESEREIHMFKYD